MKIAVIGAGIGGLAAAVRMAIKGHEVDVYEANAYPGGKLSEFEIDGFRFDFGPSLFTMPQYVTELFELAGKKPSDYFEYEPLEVVCHYFWEDGTRLNAFQDMARFAEAVDESIGPYGKQVKELLLAGKKKYELTGRIFLEKSLHKWQTWWDQSVGKAMLHLPSFDLFRSMHKVHQSKLGDPKLVQLFDRFATYNGSNPYRAPGLLSMIPYFEHGMGAFFPKGGMYHISQSIFKLAKELGVTFHFNAPVKRILVKNKKVAGILVNEEKRRFDRIISNMDVFFVYDELMPDQKRPERVLRQEKSTSALIFYWGINRTFPELGLHNILFSGDYRQEFALLNKGQVTDDPTVYINISSKYCPSDAPDGGENWFTMINVPPNQGQDWTNLIPRIRQQTIEKVNRMLGTNLFEHIVCEDVLSPVRIERQTKSHLGALYGTSSNNRMAAFLRHANFSNRIEGLYFCGGSVHPGGGIPLALLSAKIVDDLLI